jgi:dynein heavy chain 1
MSPKDNGIGDQAATSPALFNRCVLDWFGDWSSNSFYQTGLQLTSSLDMNRPNYEAPMALDKCCDLLGESVDYQQAVINSFVHIHNTVRRVIESEKKKNHQVIKITNIQTLT